MNKIVKIGLGVVLAGALCAGSILIYVFHKPHRNIADEKSCFTVKATDLWKDYKKDETAANKKYLAEANGKVIEISGRIDDIINGQNNEIVIILKDTSMNEGAVNCSLSASEKSKISTYSKGKQITLKGECTGWIDLTSEVSLGKCLILEK